MIKKIIEKIVNEINDNKKLLTELDRKIGDADHGNNIDLGFQEFKKVINNVNDNTQEVFKKLGFTIMSKTGGASGPLYGMSFIKGSSSMSKDKNTYSLGELKEFVALFCNSIKKLGNAKIGDKTMLDVWEPLSLKMEDIDDKNFDKNKILIFIEEFANKTIDLKAKRGRASYLGERSIGVKDPGAASSEIILKCLVEGISND